MQLVLAYPLVVQISCRTSRLHVEPSTTHPITIEADGTVRLPHDIAAERIAVALGGTSSCLELIDHTVPAFRTWLELRHRTDPHPIDSTDGGLSWQPTLRAPCCLPGGYVRPEDAARHARDPRHVAATHAADATQLRQLIAAAKIPEPLEPTEPDDRRLWEWGIDPARAHDVALRLRLPGELPPEFHLARMVTQPDLTWIATTLRGRDAAPDLAVWLAWTYDDDDRARPEDRSRWLDLGLSTWSIATLKSAGYSVEELEILTGSWTAEPEAVALRLADWAQHGLRPDIDAFTGDQWPDADLPPEAPSAQALGALRRVLGLRHQRVSDTQLALRLAHGNEWSRPRPKR